MEETKIFIDSLAPAGEKMKEEILLDKISDIKKRCAAAGIEFQEKTLEDGEILLRVSLNAGHDKRSFAISNVASANRLLDIDFENYCFLVGYEAICSYKDQIIEASIRSSTIFHFSLLENLRGEPASMESDETREVIIQAPISPGTYPSIRLGMPSAAFRALTRSGNRGLTVTLSNVKSKQHDDAIKELRKYTDSLFFQIDLIYDNVVLLERERRRPVFKKSKAAQSMRTVLEYPKSDFNESAISLYWYARSARGMPLLQFLAFYQSVEFYFPRFSYIETRRKLALILKNPVFRPERDDDVDRVISAVQSNRLEGVGDEKSQLRAVVNQCISPEEIRAFLEEDTAQIEHHTGKTSKVRYHKIPIMNKTLDLRNDVADRIYDIRCKIVHTKNNRAEDSEMLLPFSKDAEYLSNDIELMQFISRSVLEHFQVAWMREFWCSGAGRSAGL